MKNCRSANPVEKMKGMSVHVNKSNANWKFAGLFVLFLASLCLSGCKSTAILKTKGGIRVTASSDKGNVTLKQDGSGVVSIGTGGFKFQVDDAKVTVDGNLASEIPKGTKSVSIVVNKGVATIEADGKEIYSSKPK